MPADDLYPPIHHGAWWVVVGIVLLVAVTAWLWWVWWTTRPPAGPAGPPQPVRGRALDELRRSYLARIDEVATAHGAGRMATRDAFQALSPLVRRFAFEASGFPAHVKSLAELEREHPGELPAAVAVLYPDEFADAVRGDVSTGVARARQLIGGWS